MPFNYIQVLWHKQLHVNVYDFVRTKTEYILKNIIIKYNLSLINMYRKNFIDFFDFDLQNKIFLKPFWRHCISCYAFPAGYKNRNILRIRLWENRAKNIFRTKHILFNWNYQIGSFDFNYLWIGVLISVTYELVLVFRELKKTHYFKQKQYWSWMC